VKRKWKIWLIVIAVVVVTVGALVAKGYSQRGIVVVQTGRVSRQDLVSVVTASGEIKPKNYVNIGSNAVLPSMIMEIVVKEGDRVRRGQLLARLESVQPEADVAAQKASVSSAEADATAMESSLVAADESLLNTKATIERTQADLEQSNLSYQRTEELYKDKLVAKQDWTRGGRITTRRRRRSGRRRHTTRRPKPSGTRRPRSWPPRNAMWRRPRPPWPTSRMYCRRPTRRRR